ncbi:hypothetical protein KQH60_05400 [Mycetohabitans sp. B8]|uniref:hypothetical protein n=1 Tax=Mycetohabitans sp. B8 TaxID=2841845 RepID=UPI001F47F943|nr:hypothetical protein [Mycetohabitans sp. B8]MCG1042035.1 hypothetical protein [Mycetohabitans sp. B8]
MNHPLMQETFQALRNRYRQQWKHSLARERENREKLWLMMRLLNAAEGHFRQTVETGQLARHTLEQQTLMTKARRELNAVLGVNALSRPINPNA